MNLQRVSSSGSLRTPILRPSTSTSQQNILMPPETLHQKYQTLERNCQRDYTLHAIIYNQELMKRIKKQ